MKKIVTAVNDIKLTKELQQTSDNEIICRNIQYKEGILEILEFKKVDCIIIDFDLPGDIDIKELIEKILEKNEIIEIIILINEKNENDLNIENFLEEIKEEFKNSNIKIIFYKNDISLEKIKKINNYNKKDLKEFPKNNKIINFYGNRQVGKSLTIFNIANLLNNQKYKILIIELNEENQDLNILLKNEKNIKLIIYNELKFNFDLENIIDKNYDFILIENYLKNNEILSKKIMEKSNKNILIIRPNLLGIKNSKNIIEKNNLKDFDIIINNYNCYSIDEKIIKNIFSKNKIIGKIKNEINYEKIANQNFNNFKEIAKEFENIIEEIKK